MSVLSLHKKNFKENMQILSNLLQYYIYNFSIPVTIPTQKKEAIKVS